MHKTLGTKGEDLAEGTWVNGRRGKASQICQLGFIAIWVELRIS
jgi:hypothetical protein